jgi:hypothetical protein
MAAACRDQRCERRGARTKVTALVRDPDGIARYLRHLGEPTESSLGALAP